MPSARIITNVAEDAYPLAEDLRMRGFVVQIVSTHRPRTDEELAPVDLEITLEDCEPETALRLADHTPDGDDLSVFVAPGALTDGPRPIRVMSLIPEIPDITLPAPAVSPAFSPIEAREAPAPAAPTPMPVLEGPVVEPVNEEVAAAALFSLMTEDTAAAAPAREQPIFLASQAVEAPQAAKPLEKTPRAVPLSLFARMAYQALAFQARSWTERVRADERLLLKCATLAAMGAVVGISVLVLGSTAHRLDPLSPAIHSATDSVLLPAAASTPAPRNPAPQAAQTATEAKKPAPPKVAPAPAAPARVAHYSHHPDEDTVAKDFVVRYGNRAPAKKSVEIKRYSDLN